MNAPDAWLRAASVGTPKPTRRCQRRANPFGLTDRQCEAMSLYVRTGAVRQVAEQLGIRIEVACVILRRARQRMGVDNNVQAALKWDRHVRQEHRFTSSRSNSVFALGRDSAAPEDGDRSMNFLFEHDGHVYRKHSGEDYEANQVLCDEYRVPQQDQQHQQEQQPNQPAGENHE